MISTKRYQIAQDAERDSHIVKKDINIFDRRLSSSQKVILPYIHKVEEKLGLESPAILDIGSGPTCVARFFKGENKTYVDPLMSFYQEYYPDKMPTDGKLVTQKGEELEFADETFDAVLSYNMLDHTHNPQKIVEEVHRTLKKGGYLLLGIYTHSALMTFIRTCAEKSWIFKERPHPYSYTIKGVKKLVDGLFTTESLDIISGKEEPLNTSRRYYIFILRKDYS